jgi:hypothetical protein
MQKIDSENLRRIAAQIESRAIQLESAMRLSSEQTEKLAADCYSHLQEIWNTATDRELLALSIEFPGFYRYALKMEASFYPNRHRSMPG